MNALPSQIKQDNSGLNSWAILQSFVLGFLFSLFFAIFCTPTKAQDTFSPQLNQFLASHPQALLVLSNEFAETKGPARTWIDIFYFYTDNETVPTAHHNWFIDGSPGVAIFVRGGGQPLDEYLDVLFETINIRGDKVFKKLFQQAKSGQISQSNFVREILLQEFQAAKTVQNCVTHLGLKPEEIAKSVDYTVFLNTPSDFEKFMSYAMDPKHLGAGPGYAQLYDGLAGSNKSGASSKTNTPGKN